MLDPTVALPQRWELYRLLSEPVRLRLLALAAEEELAIGELAELLGESQPNVSRHAAPLKQAGLLSVRKQGTRALVRLADAAAVDPVVADALASGRALCDADGILSRIGDVLRARDAVAREFFAREARDEAKDGAGSPTELGAYLAALAPLLPHRELAVDAGCGDGGLLDVLAPVFTRVVAIDRAEAQLARARARIAARGFENVELVHGEIDGEAVRRAVHGARAASAQSGERAGEGTGADVVFAVRLLHHAPQPARFVAQLADLVRPGGALVVLDYGRHDDESMRDQADLWLGFEGNELRGFARHAGLDDAHVARVAAPLVGHGVDAHLPWQVMVARKGARDAKKDIVDGGGRPARRAAAAHAGSKKGKEHG